MSDRQSNLPWRCSRPGLHESTAPTSEELLQPSTKLVPVQVPSEVSSVDVHVPEEELLLLLLEAALLTSWLHVHMCLHAGRSMPRHEGLLLESSELYMPQCLVVAKQQQQRS